MQIKVVGSYTKVLPTSDSASGIASTVVHIKNKRMLGYMFVLLAFQKLVSHSQWQQ